MLQACRPQIFCNRFDEYREKFVAISVFYTGCLERDEGCRKDNIALCNLLKKYQWQLIPLEMNIPREYNFVFIAWKYAITICYKF